MKIEFQLLHDFQEHPLKCIGTAVHQTLQEDFLLELDFKTVLDFIEININTPLQTTGYLCAFEIEIDTTIYSITRQEDFTDGFKDRLKSYIGFTKLLKYNDEFRLLYYIKYYEELAALEMKIREVFSYIFYNKYAVDQNDLFEEFDARAVGSDEPKPDELEKRLENKFFYLTFSGYLKFEKPKDVNIKELIPLIRSSEYYTDLRNYLNSRGIITNHHLDFLQAVRATLDPIESVRNCIAHNRQIPNRTEANYEKAKKELLKYIEDFWQSEVQKADAIHEITSFEQHSYERVSNLLSESDWNDSNGEVNLNDRWTSGTPAYSFKTLHALKEFLTKEADIAAIANFPLDAEERKVYEEGYDGETLINKVLTTYAKQLIIFNWI